MLKNYLKVAIRNLVRDKGNSLIIVLGLALAIAGALLIMQFVRLDWSYDNFHPDANRIYRLALFENYSPQEQHFNTMTPFPAGPAMKQSFPEVVRFARIGQFSDIVQRETTAHLEPITVADASLFEMFSFPLIEGNPGRALADPGSVVLSRKAAAKYFGAEDPLNKTLTITINGKPRDFRVSAVARDIPENSSIKFDILLSLELANEIWNPRALRAWFNVNHETYVELAAGGAGKALEGKLEVLSKLAMGTSYKPGAYVLRLQPLRDIHLDKSFPVGLQPTSDPAYSYILAGIAILVLFVAGVNFVALSIGRSASRAREVGVRKVVGAERPQLMRQFWGEAVLTSFLALLMGILLAELFLPVFRSLVGRSIELRFDAPTVGLALLLTAVVGLAAGAYPAAVLSSFRPGDVLKGRLAAGDKGRFRRALLVFQFALSIFLVVCAITMARQLHFLRVKNLGFHGEQVVVVKTHSQRAEGERLIELFREEVKSRPDIIGVAGTGYAFGDGWIRCGFTTEAGGYKTFSLNIVTFDFLKVMGIELAAGRDFSRDTPSDAREAVIINEAFAREFNLGPAVGLRLPGKHFPPHQIIGLVKDFHFASLHESIGPLVLAISPEVVLKGVEDVDSSSSGMPKILARVRPGDIPAAVDGLRKAWQKIAPGLPFDFSFVDEDFNRQYQADDRWGRIVNYSTVFSVVIACLGLFGLASIAMSQRTKEIGIRKTLGSSVAGLVALLSMDFIKLVALSNLLAWPLAYYAMNRWLQGFAYRISIGWVVFLVAGLLGVAAAQATVTFQAVKAALADPVRALKYE